MSETLNGSSTIKAYSAQDRFIKNLENKIDDNSSFLYSVNFSERFKLLLINSEVRRFSKLCRKIAKKLFQIKDTFLKPSQPKKYEKSMFCV